MGEADLRRGKSAKPLVWTGKLAKSSASASPRLHRDRAAPRCSIGPRRSSAATAVSRCRRPGWSPPSSPPPLPLPPAGSGSPSLVLMNHVQFLGASALLCRAHQLFDTMPQRGHHPWACPRASAKVCFRVGTCLDR